jgi:hypothetical protein
MSLPTVLGEHVVVTADGVDYRIACAGSGRWTVTVLSATLELTSGVYTYAQAGERGDAGEDWRELLGRRR